MSATQEQRNEAFRIVLQTFEKLEVPELSKILSIEWKNAFTQRMGDAKLKKLDYSQNFKTLICFSVPLWALAFGK